jgi:Putative MetA-pathway of phenol degradation
MFMTALRNTTLALCLSLLAAAPAMAGHPLITDDAGTVDVGKYEIELNGSYTYDKEQAAGITSRSKSSDSELLINTGLYKDLGIAISLPYTFSTRTSENNTLVSKDDGFGDMTLEVKYAFAEAAGINFAIKPGLTLPTGKKSLSDEHLQYATTLIASKEFSDGKYALHANLGYEYHTYKSDSDAGRRSIWSGSVAGEMEVVKGLVVVGNLGISVNPDRSSDTLPAYALTGVRYEINETVEINAGIKLGLTKPEDDLQLIYGMVLKF